jgi:hypothetical protein
MDFEHVRCAATRPSVSAAVERDLDPEICRLFIIDGPKALKQGDPRQLPPPQPDPALIEPC